MSFILNYNQISLNNLHKSSESANDENLSGKSLLYMPKSLTIISFTSKNKQLNCI